MITLILSFILKKFKKSHYVIGVGVEIKISDSDSDASKNLKIRLHDSDSDSAHLQWSFPLDLGNHNKTVHS